MKEVIIVGAGLAGSEAALTLASNGVPVRIFEQKPLFRSEAHKSDSLCELICSNSFRSNELSSGIGLLKNEMRLLKSFIIETADRFQVPAGKALAVDRTKFSTHLTRILLNHPLIKLENKKIGSLKDPLLNQDAPVILAAGPMLADELAASLAEITGSANCNFYDAIAPIVWSDSLNWDKIFRQSRYHANEPGDYINCPMNKEEYEVFYQELMNGQTIPVHPGESEKHFEGCMPIEALGARGPKTLLFGPFKPVGLVDPKTGHRPWAVLQLRTEDANNDACNLVGCQTKLLQGEQERIFRLVPGLENVEFARFGSMHRNTYINAPEVLDQDLALKNMPHIFVAGQLSGVEGYVESAASGLWTAMKILRKRQGKQVAQPPSTTALGALLSHLQRKVKDFQPSNINFGLMPELGYKIRKAERKDAYAARAQKEFDTWIEKEWLNV